jgi:dihydroorotase
MSQTGRREFLQRLGASAVVLPQIGPVSLFAGGQTGGAATYDLLIAGGHVIDPGQKLSAVRDVAISGGTIARIDANIPRGQARQVFDASGKYVTPGLIDVHGHVYDSAITISIDPDLVGVSKGVTTIVDAGSAGAGTFAGLRKYVIERAKTRVYALLNISTIGLVVANELYLDPKMIDVKAAVTTIEQNRPLILGIKVRINGRHEDLAHDIDVLKKAREASDTTGVPIMMHWTNEPDLLAILKRGDILAHPFNPPSPNTSNLMGGEGTTILPQILALKDRGIWIDFSHGGHLAWPIAEAAAKQGWFPDTISTDIHRAHVPPNGIVFDLPTTMSKFLYLGLTVDQVVEKVTTTPTKMLKFPEKIGSLAPGSVADVTVMDLSTGNFDFFDSRREKRVGHQRVVPVATVKGGKFIEVTKWSRQIDATEPGQRA